MLISLGWRQFWCRAIALATAFLILGTPAAQADSLEAYVLRYLDVKEPVPLAIDAQGETRPFSAADLSAGNGCLRIVAKTVMLAVPPCLIRSCLYH